MMNATSAHRRRQGPGRRARALRLAPPRGRSEALGRLLELLAPGRRVSRRRLGHASGLAPVALEQALRSLRRQGLALSSTHAGLCLRPPRPPRPLLLRPARLAALLRRQTTPLRALDVLPCVDSTNAALLAQPARAHARAVLADCQLAGRGRRGRVWLAAPGDALCLSLGWRFDAPPASLAALGLAVGAALAVRLQALGLRGHGLKWPNDLLWGGRKLAGILVELRMLPDGAVLAVVGIGLNLRVPPSLLRRLDQPVADLRQALGRWPDRERLAAQILHMLCQCLGRYAAEGLVAFLPDWHRYDLIYGQRVVLSGAGAPVCGIARGVDTQGALRLQVSGELASYASGEVSLRLAH